MSITTVVIITDQKAIAGLAHLAQAGGVAHAVVVGDRRLADAAAAAGLTTAWIELAATTPAEAYADAVAGHVGELAPQVLLAGEDPAGRALLGAAAHRLGAPVISGVVDAAATAEGVRVERRVANGEAIESVLTGKVVAGVFSGDEPGSAEPVEPAEITRLEAAPLAGLAESGRESLGAATGVADAARVVAVGLGVRAKDDLGIVEALASALDAEIAASMPVADDRGWIEKARYIGRSGLHIAPQLYVAVGISGAPQHMEGVRDAKVVVAINNDPDARIFRTADYGIVGDLYEVVPELTNQITK